MRKTFGHSRYTSRAYDNRGGGQVPESDIAHINLIKRTIPMSDKVGAVIAKPIAQDGM